MLDLVQFTLLGVTLWLNAQMNRPHDDTGWVHDWPSAILHMSVLPISRVQEGTYKAEKKL